MRLIFGLYQLTIKTVTVSCWVSLGLQDRSIVHWLGRKGPCPPRCTRLGRGFSVTAAQEFPLALVSALPAQSQIPSLRPRKAGRPLTSGQRLCRQDKFSADTSAPL